MQVILRRVSNAPKLLEPVGKQIRLRPACKMSSSNATEWSVSNQLNVHVLPRIYCMIIGGTKRILTLMQTTIIYEPLSDDVLLFYFLFA
jgi:hypothetical protein